LLENVELPVTVEGGGTVKHGTGVKFSRVSDHMDEGYPGKVLIESSYIVTPDNELYMTFRAKLVEGQPADTETPINLINHTYWNLSGDFKDGKIGWHKLSLPNSSKYLPLTDDLIPLGEATSVKGTPFDFHSEFGRIQDKERLDGAVAN
jgi:aldose 1-epimerase